MSEYAQDETSPPRQHGSNDSNLHNVSLEDAANNSIIGKVKSRVSSILPNRLSKWFSPSAKLHNDSLNGSICGGVNTTLPARRRRRLEVEEEENIEDDEAEVQENNHRNYTKQTQNRDHPVDVDDEDDDDSQNSDEDDEYQTERSLTKQTKRDLNVERQPPAKRSRLNIEVRDSPLITRHQPLLSSTPAVGSAYARNSNTSSAVSRSSYQRFTNLNLYSNQSKKEPAFNFGQQKDIKSTAKINTDIIDLISNTSYEHHEELAEAANVYGGSRTGISSRKSLNIPSSTSTLTGVERVYASVANLKRQPLSTTKVDLGVPPRRTSTTIQEVQDREEADEEQYEGIEKNEELLVDANANTYNGRIEGSNKRQKLINGTGLKATSVAATNEAILLDSASESGESAMDVIKPNLSNTQQRKTGLFNMSAVGGGAGSANTRNSSRTSSFGNGLNFYSHLEGRKSLFSGSNQGMSSNPLNNSTLSLTSLNRRQFNASIYGSTSALSDSRLLNTFSPFYKGKTTYGGAAAYNKYTAGAGASAVRITPTLIRPTSSLSTLSSTNSLGNNLNPQLVTDNSTISSTAKRILDLINDFATPLSEAKKMATSLKTNPNLQIPSQAKGRLNESDLNTSRAMRLSQVRTPYTRPAVILQPSGNASGRGPAGGVLPPVKELQVPTMSQLLQMKKIQNTTEKARKIAQNSVATIAATEYSLPDLANTKSSSSNSVQEVEQQKHTNKIRNKVTTSMRPSAASKDLHDEEPPPPVNLPNIAFPLMQSVPKIDIQLNKQPLANKNTISESKTSIFSSASKTESNKLNSFAFNPAPMKTTTPVSITDCKKPQQLPTIPQTTTSINANFVSTPSPKTIASTFKFSEPLQIVSTPPTHSVTKNDIEKYKFSPPLDVTQSPLSLNTNKTQPKQPQPLKEGSCLDALKKPFSLPPTTTSKSNAIDQASSQSATAATGGFGNLFKKSTNEWECDACMIRNKSEVNKCVACETPRKQAVPSTNHQTLNSSLNATAGNSSFGLQFKKSSNEWECDACMIRNKSEVTKCVACETPRKGAAPQATSALPPIKNSFGDAFKPKSGTWECQTCMISNKNEVNECIACQTKKPGSTSTTSVAASLSSTPATQFKFGFAAAATNTNSNTDAGFKALAAQQNASKWECDACMTRNDANRTKCACCEQPKPGATNTETTNSSSSKFQFGATAASKFSFGFGTGANAPKEDDLRKKLETTKTTATALVAPTQGGFQFGIKPVTNNNTSESKKDEIDSSKQLSGFKFGVPAAKDETKVKESATTLPSVAGKGFVFGTKTTTTSTTSSSASTLSSATATTANTTSVKFTLPTTTTNTTSANANNNDKPTGVTAPTFGFGSSNTSASTATAGFSFGSKIETKPAATVAQEEKKSLESFAFKTPTTLTATTIAPIKSSGFVFGSSTINTNSTAAATATTVSSTNNTTATASTAAATSSTTTTAAVKPMFSFGSNNSTTASTALNSQTTPAFGGFSFGSNATAAVTSTSAVTATTANAASTSTTSLSTTTTTTPASTNIFGSFGSGGGGGLSTTNTSATPIFGSSAAVNAPASNNLTTVSSSTTSANTPAFGAFATKTTSNVFGTFGGVAAAAGGNNNNNNTLAKTNETKPTLPVFGNVAPSSTSSQNSSLSNSSGFVFGSSTANNTAPTAQTATTGSVTSTSTTWPKNSFVFGSSTSTAVTPASTQASSTSENKDVNKPSVFGTFGMSSANNQQQTSSLFGVPAAAAAGTIASGNSTTNSSANLFGTNSASAATSNIFGASSSGNAATPTPAFGSSPFGGAASSTSATPTFGSTAASGTTTFGGFGAAANNNNTMTNTTEVKKPEAAFNFGAAPATQSTSGGFNFGSASSATKPAFNFGGTTTTAQQPSFNFTGTAETQSSTKPFQFGATPSAPVFNFNRGGALEGTPNAPFQFNAGAAPVTSNIFAPAPTPGAQTAQQAKRKIRAPIRRVTQR